MEPDRYQQNQKFYIIGLICLLLSMVFFAVGAYIFPYVAFGLIYNLPAFIFDWTDSIQAAYAVSEKRAGWLILMSFFLLGAVFAVVTYILSNRMDKEIYAAEEVDADVEKVEEKKPVKEVQETGPKVLKILLIIVGLFIVAKFFQWAIFS